MNTCTHCLNCMAPVEEGQTCPSCGAAFGSVTANPRHLPGGIVLAERYLVGKVLGEGASALPIWGWICFWS